MKSLRRAAEDIKAEFDAAAAELEQYRKSISTSSGGFSGSPGASFRNREASGGSSSRGGSGFP